MVHSTGIFNGISKERPAVKDKKLVKDTIDQLNKILECELAGVVRYTHYSLMVFGHNRIPIVKWLREQAAESLGHAGETGEHITTLGGHPSLKIGKLVETEKHSLTDILTESLEHEELQIENLYGLLKMVEGHSVYLEEFARDMIAAEEAHVAEVKKMLRVQPK
jgi:bacterioferritin